MDPIKALRDELRAFRTETEDRLRRLEKVQRADSSGTYRPTAGAPSSTTPPPSPKKS